MELTCVIVPDHSTFLASSGPTHCVASFRGCVLGHGSSPLVVYLRFGQCCNCVSALLTLLRRAFPFCSGDMPFCLAWRQHALCTLWMRLGAACCRRALIPHPSGHAGEFPFMLSRLRINLFDQRCRLTDCALFIRAVFRWGPGRWFLWPRPTCKGKSVLARPNSCSATVAATTACALAAGRALFKRAWPIRVLQQASICMY